MINLRKMRDSLLKKKTSKEKYKRITTESEKAFYFRSIR